MHMRIKHIAIKYHYLREVIQEKEVRMEYVNTKEQLADIFTKSLPKEAHDYIRGKLGVFPLSKYTIEAKYVVFVVNCTNVVWITQFLKGMKEEITKHVVIYYDNTSVILYLIEP